MGMIRWSSGGTFLRERLQNGEIPRVFATSLRLLHDHVADITDSYVEAFDGLAQELRQKLARAIDSHPHAHQLALRMQAADSTKISDEERMAILDEGRDSSLVVIAASKLRSITPSFERKLTKDCFDMKEPMKCLASNPSTSCETLRFLLEHTNIEVRMCVAEEVCKRRRILGSQDNDDVSVLYTTLIQRFEPQFASALIPVCRDESQLDQIFYGLEKPSVHEYGLFVDNPYSSDQLLAHIAAERDLNFQVGGRQILHEAQALLEKRNPSVGLSMET